MPIKDNDIFSTQKTSDNSVFDKTKMTEYVNRVLGIKNQVKTKTNNDHSTYFN
jgi:hypothetical protein